MKQMTNKQKKEKKEKNGIETKEFDAITIFSKYTMIFLIGSIVGFIYEQVFYYIFENTLAKRGFLYGPYLPVYGFGAILIVCLLKRYKKNPFIVFILAMLVTGVVEYITGFVMYELYHKVWWDYTGLFFNIDGYVCLRSVLTFGIGGLILIYVIEPLMCKLSETISSKFYLTTSIVIIIMFVIDLTFTLVYKNKL